MVVVCWLKRRDPLHSSDDEFYQIKARRGRWSPESFSKDWCLFWKPETPRAEELKVFQSFWRRRRDWAMVHASECCEATEYSVWISFNRIECNKSAGKSVWLNHIRNGVVCKNLIGLFGAVLSWPHNAKKILQWPMKTNGSLKWYAGNFGYPNSRGERARDTLSQSIATVQKVNLTNFIRKHERREPPFKGRGRSNLWETCCQACT